MHHGHCLCGAVQITLLDTYTAQLACHCVSCQRWTGGPFSSAVVSKRDRVTIEGEIKKYDYVGFNKDNVCRWHCPTCGSCIGHTTSLSPDDVCVIQTGNFDSFRTIPFEAEYNVQMKWMLPSIPGAKQVHSRPNP